MSEIATPGQLRMSYWRWAMFTVPALVLIGSLMGLLSNSGYDNRWFMALDRPAIVPPGWVFGVVWTTLYVLLGLSLAMILHARGARHVRPLRPRRIGEIDAVGAQRAVGRADLHRGTVLQAGHGGAFVEAHAALQGHPAQAAHQFAGLHGGGDGRVPARDVARRAGAPRHLGGREDRKSTRLNSSHW